MPQVQLNIVHTSTASLDIYSHARSDLLERAACDDGLRGETGSILYWGSVMATVQICEYGAVLEEL